MTERLKKLKAQDLDGTALCWAVAKAEGYALHEDVPLPGSPRAAWWISGRTPDPNARAPLLDFRPDIDWCQGGPILEQGGISVECMGFDTPPYWVALSRHRGFPKQFGSIGPTPLIAAMRCYVTRKLGDEIDVPEDLLDEDRPQPQPQMEVTPNGK